MGNQLDLPERILHLRNVDLFQDLPVNELAAVALVATEVDAPPETIMFTKDCDCEGFYVIVSGEVAVEQNGGTDNQVTQYTTWEAGQSFGMAALFQDHKMNMIVRTTVDSVFLRIEREEFHAIIREYPEIALRTCQVLSTRMGLLLEQLNLAHNHAAPAA